jgi:SAM domain (Sterile alpha motif)
MSFVHGRGRQRPTITREAQLEVMLKPQIARLARAWWLQPGALAENGIDVSVLPHLTDQDLKDVSVLLGHRRKILAAVAPRTGSGIALKSRFARMRKFPERGRKLFLFVVPSHTDTVCGSGLIRQL